MKRDAERAGEGCCGVDRSSFDASRAMRQPSMSRRPKRATLRAMLVLTCVLLATLCLAGCRVSDALTEVIYDQTSTNIDYDNENKYLINDSTAEIKDSRVPSKESDHNGRVTEEKQNIVVYSSDPNAPQFTAKKSVWSKDPDFTGIEASESVRFYESDDPDATEQDIETPPEDEPEEQEEPPQTDDFVAVQPTNNTDEGSEGVGESSSEGTQTGNNGQRTTAQQSTTGGGAKSESEDSFEDIPVPADSSSSNTGDDPGENGESNGNTGDSNEGSLDNVSDSPAVMEDTAGNFTELPAVDSIAAVGQAAVVVQMIGGAGALAAADSELLDSQFSSVFADEGAADIVRAWTDGGSAAAVSMDAIAQSGAQLLIVEDRDFTANMPELERKKLNKMLEEKTIQKVMYADLSNTTNLKSFVRKIGQSLRDSTTIGNKGKTEDIAEQYVSFHDTLVRDCANNNGGLAYDPTSPELTVYELGGNVGKLSTGDQLGFNGEAKYTLLIDEWDSSVSYLYGDAWNPSMSGMALSKVGFADSPVSYYIQAGGLINNAAARGNASDPGLFPVWQFSSMLPVIKDPAYVAYSTGGPFDLSKTPSKRASGSGWDSVLLTTSQNLAWGSPNPGSSYGTTLFPKLIAATQEIKRQMIDNSDGDDDEYHPFETTTDDVRGARGFNAGGDEIYFSCIGAPGASETVTRTIGDSITDADIVVNPHGLFCSWTEYGSVEGVLEAAWVNDVVNGESASVDWLSKVTEFYNTFYRYDCSADLATIENGLAG